MNRVEWLYHQLCQQYGEPVQYWPNWCARNKTLHQREVIIIGSILTQRTSWHNAELALRNLKQAKVLSLARIAGLRGESLVKLTKPAGFSTTKPRRLKELCSFLIKDYGGLRKFLEQDLGAMREKLLSLNGIGPETADTILLYGGDKPSFVIDEYTRRWVRKHQLTRELSYNFLKDFFEQSLPRDYRLYQDFHALIIIDQKGVTKAMMASF